MRKIKNSVIYKIVNIVDGKVYIGSAIDFEYRKNSHISTLRRNKHRNCHLQNAWNLYGEGCFRFEIIEEVQKLVSESRRDFKERLVSGREQYYLDKILHADKETNYFSEFGYNINRIASSRLGASLSQESKNRLSESHKGIKPSDETKQKMKEAHSGSNNSFYGKKHSIETINKISIKLKGRKLSEEIKDKIKSSHKSVRVNQFILERKILSFWNSKKEILSSFPLYEKLTISNNHEVLSNGFFWRNHGDKIIQYELEKIFVREWDSLKEAASFNKIPYQHIIEVCKNKRRKTSGNFYWEYVKV